MVPLLYLGIQFTKGSAMSFIPTLVSKKEETFRCSAIVLYFNGQEKFEKEYQATVLTNEILNSMVRAEITGLTQKKASMKGLTYEPGDEIDIRVPAEIPPTPEVLAERAFIAQDTLVKRLEIAVSRGYEQQARLDDALALARKLYLSAYLEVLA